MPGLSRDSKISRDISRLSFHVMSASNKLSDLSEQAKRERADAHAALYQEAADELADAAAHIDRATVLMDPRQTDASEFEEREV